MRSISNGNAGVRVPHCSAKITLGRQVGTIADGIGNPLAGTITGGEFYTMITPDPQFIRGNANNDFAINIADAVALLSHLFAGGAK